MAKTPKPLRRWKRKFMRSMRGEHKLKMLPCGTKQHADTLRPRTLRIYR